MVDGRWVIWRQDDNGNKEVFLETFATEFDARERISELEAKGHKQTYWIEPELPDRYVDLVCDELAAHVRQSPGVLDQARDGLARMPSSVNVDAWRSLLDAGPSAVVAVLTSRDPDARGLKADNPLAQLGLIDEDTRLALLRQARPR